ncbi:VWA domain-containing protein [Synechococcus sp. PCC 6312]|uniref:VWA domain-containing protein n=1 Tax=Synechococcus sp. (strain ATCC 27167 / PCC 6312) TaxID=195253 RepID=UPI00029F2A55|nr:VWA domain-containing protein [Synechococcus sp. PCC 6312]AFY60054.1 hypothetical protein Syn6312_0840 [Synechococcus sp. PCC 6312]
MKPIETASELYREIKKRGLHLRKENGRDNSLLQELKNKLGCENLRLQEFFDTTDLSAEVFLKNFLQLSAPFACMFKEIWHYLNSQYAPNATETISVRFGFEDSEDQCSVDLEQFRRYVETIERFLSTVTTQLWPREALNRLFHLGNVLIDEANEPTRKLYNEHGRYEPGKSYKLPIVSSIDHPFDKIIKDISEVFKCIIDSYVVEQEHQRTTRQLPELKGNTKESEEQMSLRLSTYLLTDLLPVWFYILDRYPEIKSSAKDTALKEYKNSVEPLLLSKESITESVLWEALDILDLPFWRHRWHTYEVWASVLTLQSLKAYRPTLRIEKGHVALDGFSAAVVADLKASDHSSACLAVQVETPFKRGKRKAIKPDLRVCFDNPKLIDNTAGVVEFKQRWKINRKELEEMAIAYSRGCPKSGGVIILNYDKTDTPVSLPPRAYLIEGVHPQNPNNVKQFQQQLLKILEDAGLIPMTEETVVLLDVSSSMGYLYQDSEVQKYLCELLAIPWIKIFRFNDGLIAGGDIDTAMAQNLTTSGGTQLGKALLDIESLFGLPTKLLIVTDGEHDNPRKFLDRIQNVKECLPGEIGKEIQWLR